MRPSHLTIEGLTAFRTLQEIDFRDLDLFVITGPTGAGKTSILDAITFALYGDICRVKSGELRDLISHGATHVKVSLDFRINGTTYRVARRMKKVGQGHDVQFVRLEGEQEVPACDASGVTAVNKAIEEVLGLDFPAFTKAVLLPQGAFHEFLKGDASARRKILVDLLDLSRYLSAGGRARNQANLLAARLDERAKLLESEYGDATAERLKAAKAEAKTAKGTYQELQSVEEQVKEKIASAQAGEAIAATASSAEEAFRALETEIAEYAQELVAITNQLDERKATAVDASKAVKAGERALIAARTAVEKVVVDAGDEAAIALLQAAAATRTSEGATLAGVQEQLAAAIAAVVTAEEIHAAALATAKGAKLAQTHAQKDAEAATGEFDRTIVLLDYARASAEAESSQAQLATAEKARAATVGAAEAARTHLRHLETHDMATTLRQGLKPGDTCPVCDATVATLPKRDRSLVTALKVAQADADKKRLAAEGAFAAAATRHEGAVQRLADAKAALPAGAKPIPAAGAEAKRVAAEKAAAKAQEHLKGAQTAVVAAEKRAVETDGTRRDAKTRVTSLEKEIKGATERLEKAESQLRVAFPARLPSDLEARLQGWLANLRDVREAAATASEFLAAAQAASADALVEQHESENLLADLGTRFAETRTRAETSLRSLEKVSSARLPPLPTNRERLEAQVESLTSCCTAYVSAAREAAQLGAKDRDRAIRGLTLLLAPLELTVDSNLELTLELIAVRREEVHTTLVRADGAVTLLKEKITKRAELEKEIRDDTVRSARYRLLADELRQDHFVAFVLRESMERLASLASVELQRISGDRYSLVPDRGSFDVVDHHNADERRSVATLSGGETFLASLALALALAGSVRDLAGSAAAARLDAIFIDEGFGALDPETLEVVLDALERLREGERMVGVISHVDELAQRIPQGLVVSKVGGASIVQPR